MTTRNDHPSCVKHVLGSIYVVFRGSGVCVTWVCIARGRFSARWTCRRQKNFHSAMQLNWKSVNSLRFTVYEFPGRTASKKFITVTRHLFAECAPVFFCCLCTEPICRFPCRLFCARCTPLLCHYSDTLGCRGHIGLLCIVFRLPEWLSSIA